MFTATWMLPNTASLVQSLNFISSKVVSAGVRQFRPFISLSDFCLYLPIHQSEPPSSEVSIYLARRMPDSLFVPLTLSRSTVLPVHGLD
jgi:hypothetical protein